MGIFDWFKPSPFNKAHSMLKQNDLIPQAMLLKQAASLGYTTMSKPDDPTTFTDSHKDLEIKMLSAQKVNMIAAVTSIGRFQLAVEICEECGLKDAANFFKQYVDLYKNYVKKLSDK